MAGHERYLELVAASIDFDLTPAESAALTAHLAACAACRSEGTALQSDARALRRLSDGVPSPAIRERVLAHGAGTSRHRPSPLVALAAAAALVVGVVGGLGAGAFLLANRQPAPATEPTWSRLLAEDGFPAGSGHSAVLAMTRVADLAGIHLVAVGKGGGDGRVWVSEDGATWSGVRATGLAAARPVAVAEAGGKLIAVGDAVIGGDSVATAWISTDARTWDAISFEGSTGLQAVVASPARIVVAGLARTDGGFPVWSSTDGRTWTRAWQTTRYENASVTGLALGGPGFVAVGYDDLGAVAWTSADGLTWKRVDDAASFVSARMTAVAATPAGLVAVGGDARGALAWVSLDGVAWTPSARFGSARAMPNAMASTPYGIIVVGGAAGGDQAWVSSDGRSWQPIRNGLWTAAPDIHAVTASGPLVVVAGASDDRAGVWLGRVPTGSQ